MKKNIKLIFNSELARKLNTVGITLYPNIYFSFPEESIRDCRDIIKHELVHVEQIERSSVFKFYSMYCLEWLVKTIFGKGEDESAYFRLQDEKEARARQREPFTPRDYEILRSNYIVEYNLVLAGNTETWIEKVGPAYMAWLDKKGPYPSSAGKIL